jgi:short-subunit dehydrogenase
MITQPVILITGASSGIGAAAARRFARQGYRVALAARRLERLQALAAEIHAQGGEALFIETDVSLVESLQSMSQTTLAAFGQIDVLFNNAGFGRHDWLENLDPAADIAAQVQVNLLGAIQATRAVLPHMVARRRGHIINMASIAGLIGSPTLSVYAATKFGVLGFSEALRREVGWLGIHVSVICPGGVATEFGEHTGARRKTGITSPKWLTLEASDVARVVYNLTRRPRRMVVIPRWYLPLVWLNHLLPGLADWVIERGFVRRERGV